MTRILKVFKFIYLTRDNIYREFKMKKIYFFACVLLSFVSLSCNRTRTTTYRGGDGSYQSLIAAQSGLSLEASSIIKVDNIGWEASAISYEIKPPIKDIYMDFSGRDLSIKIEDSHGGGSRKLEMTFEPKKGECGVYIDQFGSVRVKRAGDEYTTSFSDREGNWYVLGSFNKRPLVECIK